MAGPVRIALIEDNDVFREALRLLLTLDGDIEVAGEEADGSRAVELCRRVEPDVALVDYRLPGLDGVQVTRALRRECPGVAIVALTAAAGNREMQAMLDAGAATCIRKDEPLDSIAQAVRAAAPAEAA